MWTCSQGHVAASSRAGEPLGSQNEADCACTSMLASSASCPHLQTAPATTCPACTNGSLPVERTPAAMRGGGGEVCSRGGEVTSLSLA